MAFTGYDFEKKFSLKLILVCLLKEQWRNRSALADSICRKLTGHTERKNCYPLSGSLSGDYLPYRRSLRKTDVNPVKLIVCKW